MLKDIIIYNGETIYDYKYEVVDGELVINFDIKDTDKVNIIYDINIYENITFNKLKTKKVSDDELTVYLKNNADSFKLKVNEKFFVKNVYGFINRFVTKFELIDALNLFKELNAGKVYIEELNELIEKIDTPEGRVKGFNLSIEDDRIDLVLFGNDLYKRLASKLRYRDLLLLVVAFDGAYRPPLINGGVFNLLVSNALKFKRYRYYLCVLANTYKESGLNYDRIDSIAITEKDVNFFIKYISLDCVDKEKLLIKVKKKGRKKFVEELKNSEKLKEVVGEELFSILLK